MKIEKACLCESCTCTGCREACFGHCQGCGDPTSDCNSYQTGGEKFLPEVPVTLDEALDRPEPPDGSTSGEALATVPDALPAFDYSGLDARTRDSLHVAETLIKEARQKFISDVADAVAIAHDALCGVVQNLHNSKHGNRGEGAFCAWCASVGFSRTAAYNLLRVSTLFKGSTPIERQVLEQAQPSVLYEIARPSAPAEGVAAVKSGDITTLKEYKDLMAQLKAERAAREDAEAESKANSALLAEEQRRRKEVQQMAIEAGKKREEAEGKAKEALQGKQAAELERDSARNMLKKAQQRADMLSTDCNAAVNLLNEANAELAALRAAPIEMAVAEPDPAEIERLATEKAEAIAAQRTALLEAQMRGMQHDLNDLRDSAYQTQTSSVDTVFAFAVNAAITVDTLRETFLGLAEGLQEDDFWSAFKPLADAAWKIADIEASAMIPDCSESVSEESEAVEA